ncbi:DUF1826 domain-containing protein [Roseibium algae]|uniref:DUF1826 domain-containing protein n=1 Tax=Roseibium algae TaxID=3123038 RepID=A0ABU8TFS9_9HYPH
MKLQHEFMKDVVAGVGLATTPNGLSSIEHPGCAAAIWQRQPLKTFQDWIDSLEKEVLPRARIILRPEVVRAAMTDLFEGSRLPECNERSMLVDDIAAMANILASVMQVPYLRLRLDVISTNACRKFHVDAVTARLICTYRGSGTQYGISMNGEEPRRICSVSTGSPMILRGTLWPEAPRSGLLHRSPPIEGTEETRLVLVLDPISDIDGGLDQQLIH